MGVKGKLFSGRKFIFILAFLCLIPLAAIPSRAAENYTLTVDGNILPDGGDLDVLSKDLGKTAPLNVYVFSNSPFGEAELRLYRGGIAGGSLLAKYLLANQTTSGFDLTEHVVFTQGKYTLALFEDGSAEDPILTATISVSRAVISEVITGIPTCVHGGTKLITYADDNDPSTPDSETKLIPPLGHIWGSWDHNSGAHTHTRKCSREDCNMSETLSCEYSDGICMTCLGNEGHRHVLAFVQRKEPTCTEPGNKEYYVCQCGKMFEDLGAKNETEDPSSVILPSLGHSFGDWSYNAKDKTHTRICMRNVSHRETENCNFTAGTPADDGTVVYTCAICKGSFTAENQYPRVLRIEGKDRFETAILVAETLKESLGTSKFSNIIVASGLDFADALSGSFLANVKNAPILLVKKQTMDVVAEYISENLDENGTVYILGGPNAVPEQMEEKLTAARVIRLQGSNRYETNLAIIREAEMSCSEMLVCTGLNFADGLSVSAVDLPVLLVKNKLTDDQKEFLSSCENITFHVIGGENAVCRSVENELRAFGAVDRISGANRYETSVCIAEKFFPDAKYAVLAYGENYPDGLSAGPLAHSLNMPLLLSSDRRSAIAAEYTRKNNISHGIVLGGEGLISGESIHSIFGDNKNTVTRTAK